MDDPIVVTVVKEPQLVVVPVKVGPAGPAGRAGRGFSWHGQWHHGDECEPGHVAKYNGAIWVSLTNTTGEDAPSFDNPKWAPVFTNQELQGPPGQTVMVGRRWFGVGPPTVVVGSSPGDEYVDVNNGDLYQLI